MKRLRDQRESSDPAVRRASEMLDSVPRLEDSAAAQRRVREALAANERPPLRGAWMLRPATIMVVFAMFAAAAAIWLAVRAAQRPAPKHSESEVQHQPLATATPATPRTLTPEARTPPRAKTEAPSAQEAARTNPMREASAKRSALRAKKRRRGTRSGSKRSSERAAPAVTPPRAEIPTPPSPGSLEPPADEIPRPAPAPTVEAIDPSGSPARLPELPPLLQPSPAPRDAVKPRRRSPTAEEARLVSLATSYLRREKAPAAAARLLGEYLKKYPQGALLEEALALALEAAVARRSTRAASLARRYLKEFPRGRFRRAARQVLRRVKPPR